MKGTAVYCSGPFTSSHVRIQADRGHAVDSSGPLRIVRHPGYTGDALAWIAVPFLFSSYWVAIPTVIVLLAYIARIRPEDRTLRFVQGFYLLVGSVVERELARNLFALVGKRDVQCNLQMPAFHHTGGE